MKHVKWVILCVLFLFFSNGAKAASGSALHWLNLPVHSLPTVIVPDKDTSVWFGDEMKHAIAHIDTMGHLRYYQVKGIVNSLARDKSNRVWFGLYEGGIGYIENGHVMQLSYIGPAYSLTFNEGAIWFLSGPHGYGSVNNTGHINLFHLSESFNATSMTGGPDGNLWLTDYDNDTIGKLDSYGLLVAYPLQPGSQPVWITSGPDKTLWFLNRIGVGSITLSGKVKEYTLKSSPNDFDSYGNIMPDQNGDLIFSMDGKINQITPDGKVTAIASLVGEGRGSDNGYVAQTSQLLWFTDLFAGKIAYLYH